jgi:hypothetical protein
VTRPISQSRLYAPAERQLRTPISKTERLHRRQQALTHPKLASDPPARDQALSPAADCRPRPGRGRRDRHDQSGGGPAVPSSRSVRARSGRVWVRAGQAHTGVVRTTESQGSACRTVDAPVTAVLLGSAEAAPDGAMSSAGAAAPRGTFVLNARTDTYFAGASGDVFADALLPRREAGQPGRKPGARRTQRAGPSRPGAARHRDARLPRRCDRLRRPAATVRLVTATASRGVRGIAVLAR